MTAAQLLRALAPTGAAVLALAVLPSPATAYSSTSSGLVGELSYSETTTTPIGTCGYAGPAWRDTNWIWMGWMRVTAPTVTAADRSSTTRDRRTVAFQLKIQRRTLGSSDPWRVVRSSTVQTAPAWDDEPADLTPITLSYTPDKTFANGQSGIFRAMVLVRWLKKDGTVEGATKIWPSYYRVSSPYYSKPYPTHADPHCSARHTDG